QGARRIRDADPAVVPGVVGPQQDVLARVAEARNAEGDLPGRDPLQGPVVIRLSLEPRAGPVEPLHGVVHAGEVGAPQVVLTDAGDLLFDRMLIARDRTIAIELVRQDRWLELPHGALPGSASASRAGTHHECRRRRPAAGPRGSDDRAAPDDGPKGDGPCVNRFTPGINGSARRTGVSWLAWRATPTRSRPGSCFCLGRFEAEIAVRRTGGEGLRSLQLDASRLIGDEVESTDVR